MDKVNPDVYHDMVVEHIQTNTTPQERLKLEVERTSAGKHRICVKVAAHDIEELLDTTLAILQETKSRLGIAELEE